MSLETQRKYEKQYFHIGAETVAGKIGQTCASDVFSLGSMGKVVFKKAKLGLVSQVLSRANCVDPAGRLTLRETGELLG